VLIAERLRETWPDAAQLTRWGPEQFVALVTSAGMGDEELHALGGQLLAALTVPVLLEGRTAKVGAVIGIARLTDRLHWQRLIQHAASAAREARAGGGVCLYRHDASASSGTQRDLLHALRESLESGGLELHYQPIVNTSTGRAHALEALVRWRHKTLGEIPPATFIPMLEASGDIVALGQWVLWNACHEALPLVRDGQLGLSVNVSPQQMLDTGFLPHLKECLARSGLPPQLLQLELTETALASDLDRLSEVMSRVRALKVRLAVDDFGTGYSSLSYLNRLPIDTLKVDQIFVQDFHRGGKTIIKAALAVAMDFGQDVIVEGVESDEMLREICDLGVSLVQGFWFAKPMPGHEVAQWLQSFPRTSSAAVTAD
jgi:EAL domain-containing protein (putative c-di-GMP-specific phosphodiesterase class I)